MSNLHFVVAALYQFKAITHLSDLKEKLLDLCKSMHIKGTLILASEGINGTVAGSRVAIDQLYQFLRTQARFNNLEYKESLSEACPFLRLKIHIKPEIVTLGLPQVNPGQISGTYVEPQDWNALITDPEVLVIDTRNDYEVQIGTFKEAINPKTNKFSQFPEWVENNLNPQKHRKIAMMCTGGIRCEKASSYMKQIGFEHVYHLKGGILKYLETIQPEQSLWQGECFVFDNRVAVTHGLKIGKYDQCFGCRMPLSPQDKASPDFQSGISCPYCKNHKTADDRARYAERHRQIQRARQNQQTHLGS